MRRISAGKASPVEQHLGAANPWTIPALIDICQVDS
jgi:hypothetical protein